jgi:hypothetical protein
MECAPIFNLAPGPGYVQAHLQWSFPMMMQMSNVLPGLPPLSILTVIGASVMISTLVLYMLSRVPELLLITFIAGMYAMVPVIGMMKHI